MSGRRAAGAAASLGALALAACAPLPQAPPPLPATFIPEVALPSAQPQVPVGPDGFSVVERVAMRVSVVTCTEYANGSAWVLDEDTVVTNRHVVEGAVDIELTSYDGRHYTGTTSVLDPTSDLALVHIDGTFPEVATVAAQGPVSAQELYIVGYPEADRLTTTIARYQDRVEETLEPGADDVDFLAAVTKEGNSGSAVANVDGEVVGVLYASNGAGRSYAVTLESLQDFLADPSTHEPNEADCGW